MNTAVVPSEARLLPLEVIAAASARAFVLSHTSPAPAPEPEARRGNTPSVRGGRLVFTFHDEAARDVQLYGDFRGAMGVVARLVPCGGGRFETALELPLPGRYRYKFIVDGVRWVEDPSHELKEEDGFGGFNSVLRVTWDIR